MDAQLVNDNLVIETIRALWRKRELDGAMALVVRIPDAVQQKLWKATLLIAKAELASDYSKIDISTDFFEDVKSLIIDPEMAIDVALVQGRIAMTNGNYETSEDFFFQSLLDSRNSNYLLGKVQSMIGLGRIKLLNNNFEQALDLVVTADSLTEKITANKRPFIKSEVLLLQCLVLLGIQDYDRLKSTALKLLELSESCGETHKYLHALNFKAVVYASKGDLKTAMPYFLEALDFCKTIQYENLAAKISTNIATLHGQLQNFDEALERYHYILEEYTAPIRPEEKAVIYNNIGNLYVRLSNWKKAVRYFIEAESIAEKKDHKPLKRLAFCQIARCLVESESYHALITHLKSEEEMFHGQPHNGLQILQFVKAKYAYSKQEYDEAIRWAKKSIDLASIFNDDTTNLHALSILAQAYEEKGDIASALAIYKQQQVKKEALEKERAKNRITNTEIDYILAAKEKEIESLQRENQLQSELIKSTSLIRRKNKELLAKNEELSYFAKMIAVDFNEHLRVVSQFVPLLDDAIASDKKEKTSEYLTFIKNAVNKVSGLIAGLHKYAFIIDDNAGLKKVAAKELFKIAEHDLAPKIKETKAIISYKGKMPNLVCDKSQLITVFKEILDNAIQFSEEPKIEVAYKEQEDFYVFKFTDNGIGVPKGEEKKIFWAFYRTKRVPEKEGNGLGLAACKNIIEKHGGVLKANTPKEGGLSISVFWPKNTTN